MKHMCCCVSVFFFGTQKKTVYDLIVCVCVVASSQALPAFQCCTRKTGGPGIYNHVHEVNRYVIS